MAKRSKKPSRLSEELREMGEALHELGALSDDEGEKTTFGDTVLPRSSDRPRAHARSSPSAKRRA